MKYLTTKNLLIFLAVCVAGFVAYHLHTKYELKKAQEKSDAIGGNFQIKIGTNK